MRANGLRRTLGEIVGWALGIWAVSSVPYWVGYLTVGPERRFMGFAFNVSDHVQYFAWWRAFQQGLWAPNLLTPEPTPATYFNLLWWLLAQLGRGFGLGYEAIYQILRAAAILMTVGVLLFLYRQVALSPATARWMAALALLGSGFAWLHPMAKRLQAILPVPMPMAPYVPSIAEPNTFFSAIAYPHFLIALASIVAILMFAVQGMSAGRWRHSLLAGALAFTLSLHHTYDLLTVGAVLGGLVLWRMGVERRLPWGWIAHATLVLGMAAPGAVYMVWLTRQDPTWREVLAQFVNAGVFTPPPLQLLLLLGLPFLLACIGIGDPRRWRDWTIPEAWMGVWFLAHFPLVYLPVSFQIHLLNGWQVPIAYWAIRGVERMAGRLRVGSARSLMRWALILSLPANLYLWGWRILDLSRGQPPYTLHRDEVAALDWLAAHGCDGGVVMAPESIGAFVPMWTGCRAFLAHWTGTLRFFERREQALAFYSAATDADRRALVQRYGITYVIVGSDAGADGSRFEGTPWLIPVFQRPHAAVLAVQMRPIGSGDGEAP
ncbi:MAG TPA: hypothetical protein VNK89_13675 [Thermoflexus sp.]|nr:hypothetical protein [Thermoflexus sp.]